MIDCRPPTAWDVDVEPPLGIHVDPTHSSPWDGFLTWALGDGTPRDVEVDVDAVRP